MAAATLIREQGLPKLTQPRVAKAAGVSQSHLTYYFPTRADLVHAVLERAAERQSARCRSHGCCRGRRRRGARSRARQDIGASREHARPCLLRARCRYRPDCPCHVRWSCRRMRATIAEMLGKVGIAPHPEAVTMVHALGTGLAILELALGGSAAQPDTAATLRQLFDLLAERDVAAAEALIEPS